MKLIRESEHIYRLCAFGLVNCFLVKHNRSCTLIDTNLPGSAEAILAAAKNLGLAIKRILTHAHFDHVGSLDTLTAQLPGVEIAIGIRESNFLNGNFMLEQDERGKPLFGFLRCSTKPTTLLNDGGRVGPFLAVSSPGHTPGTLLSSTRATIPFSRVTRLPRELASWSPGYFNSLSRSLRSHGTPNSPGRAVQSFAIFAPLACASVMENPSFLPTGALDRAASRALRQHPTSHL